MRPFEVVVEAPAAPGAASKKPNFSIKALQLAEEKQAVEQYGSSDSGASLGDILGEALKGAKK